MYFVPVWYYEFEMDYRVRSLMCKTVPSKICQCHPYIHDQARVPCRFGSRVLIGVGDIFHRKAAHACERNALSMDTSGFIVSNAFPHHHLTFQSSFYAYSSFFAPSPPLSQTLIGQELLE